MVNLNQFDIVEIKTTKNVKYLSSVKGYVPDPRGLWSVVGFIKTDVMLCKDSAIIKIPYQDVVLKASYKRS